MGWKNWPCWLKGGLIVSLSYILTSLLSFLAFNVFACTWGGCDNSDLLLGLLFALILVLPRYFFYHGLVPLTNDSIPALEKIFIILIFTLVYFIVGALIGLIYSKIRGKK